MTQPELALQKLNELREVVGEEGELAEMVDMLATTVMLKQDVSNPMFGAQVMFYEKPDGEWVDIDYDTYRELVPFDLPDDPERAWPKRTDGSIDFYDAEPWWLRWRRLDGDNDKRVPDGEIEHRFGRYMKYGEKRKVERGDVPDPLDPEENTLEEDVAHAREMEEARSLGDQWFGEWMIYEKDVREYRFTPLEPADDFVSRRAIVIEPHIAEQPAGTEFWDPNRQEYTTPEEYPMGTVNVVIPDDPDKEFGRDYTYDMRVETSVTPADGEPGAHEYTPGWDEV